MEPPVEPPAAAAPFPLLDSSFERVPARAQRRAGREASLSGPAAAQSKRAASPLFAQERPRLRSADRAAKRGPLQKAGEAATGKVPGNPAPGWDYGTRLVRTGYGMRIRLSLVACQTA